jgi:hypothetical protein
MAFITWVESHISFVYWRGKSVRVWAICAFLCIIYRFICKTGLIILWELLGDELMVGSGLAEKCIYILLFTCWL